MAGPHRSNSARSAPPHGALETKIEARAHVGPDAKHNRVRTIIDGRAHRKHVANRDIGPAAAKTVKSIKVIIEERSAAISDRGEMSH